MSVIAPTFSESWHRVANVKASLRPTVRARRQRFRGENWYVLQDSFNNQFFRLRPAAYEFVARLRPDKTIEEVWLENLQRDPEHAPGQEEAIRLLTQLHFSNLLFYDTPSDSEQFFERYRKRKQRELQSKLLAIMFVRLPLFDPDRFIQRLLPYIRFLFGWTGAILWLSVVGLAINVVIDNFDQAINQAQGILAPDNLILLYLGMVFIKSLHELGHAVTCRHFGGEVHVLGIMLLVFTPLPFMDATSSWAFRNRWHRILVGSAGMITELFIAAWAVFVWAETGPGVIHSVAYNMMFVASVSTVIYNANPLLKFDGYYILSDLVDIPNLYTRARQQWVYLFERHVFGIKQTTAVADSQRESIWLTSYGVLSGIYRVIVFSGIIVFVADKYLLLGLIMVAVLVVSWVIVPPYRFIKYLATNPKLDRTRGRAIGASAGIAVAVLLIVAVIPLPNRFRAPGIVEAESHWMVTNNAGGKLAAILVKSGQSVKAGTPLVRLTDPDLANDKAALKAQQRQVEATEQWAISHGSTDLKPLVRRKAVIDQQLVDLKKREASLIVRARASGTWVSSELDGKMDAWIPRGSQLGLLYVPKHYQFKAVVSQDDAANLFQHDIHAVEVRLHGRAGINFDMGNLKIIPYQSDQLPSAALSWLAGGDIKTSRNDKTGLKTTEPFFLIIADFPLHVPAHLFYGESGKIRLSLESQPLLWQVYRRLQQLLQQRYQF